MRAIFTVVLTLWGSINVIAGGVVENGGDSVRCVARSTPIETPEQEYYYYIYDYIDGLQTGIADDQYASIEGWHDSARRMNSILNRISENLSTSFDDYTQSLEKVQEKKHGKPRRVWRPTPSSKYGLVLGMKNIPRDCDIDIDGLGQSIFWTRIILRKETHHGAKIEYRYDKKILQNIKKKSPLQFSMFMVHEWLWDHTKNVEVNRAVNRFLHSKEIETMAPDTVSNKLKQLGLGF